MQKLEVTRNIPGPRQAVWDLYTDHVSWTEWAGMGKVSLVREGEPAPNGVGCVRVISNRGISVEEEVVSFEPPLRMSYKLTRGVFPIKDHLGEVSFEETDGGTRVVWRCRFNSTIPGLGGLWRVLITRMFSAALASLERQFGQRG